MKPVLGITVEPDQVHDLIGQESFGQAWHGFELPGFVLGDRTWDETLSQVQRGISHVRDILPDDVGVEAPPLPREALNGGRGRSSPYSARAPV